MDSTDTYYAAFGFFDTSVTEFMRAVVIQERVNKDYATIVMISLHAPWNPKDVPSAEVYKKDLERYGDLIKHPITIDQSTGLQKLEEELVLCKTRAEILAPFWDLVYQFEYFQKTRNIRRIETSLRNLSEASLQAISKQRFLELYGKKLPHAKKHHPTNLEIWMWATAMNVTEFIKSLPDEELQRNHFEMLKDPLTVLFYTKLAAEGTLRNPQDTTYDNILWLFIDNLYRTAYGIPTGKDTDYRPWKKKDEETVPAEKSQNQTTKIKKFRLFKKK